MPTGLIGWRALVTPSERNSPNSYSCLPVHTQKPSLQEAFSVKPEVRNTEPRSPQVELPTSEDRVSMHPDENTVWVLWEIELSTINQVQRLQAICGLEL